ncbi:hypothetical protein ANN_07110 [Periplaneta americana]|uniref:Uncharacterized protein n=1 Tax=Periplaneta americana TaxID=6978 RepID=A0ABQ8THZ1_PERAM|nr:hypothetical protein ANN_07110 [Periplaneta americana]
MVDLCEGGNEPPGSLKASNSIFKDYIAISTIVIPGKDNYMQYSTLQHYIKGRKFVPQLIAFKITAIFSCYKEPPRHRGGLGIRERNSSSEVKQSGNASGGTNCKDSDSGGRIVLMLKISNSGVKFVIGIVLTVVTAVMLMVVVAVVLMVVVVVV